MKWIQLQITYVSDNPDTAAELIFGQMYISGLTGLVETEPGRDETQDWAKDAPKGADDYTMTGYYPATDTTESVIQELLNGLTEVAGEGQFSFTAEKTVVDEENWAESWKEFFYPQRIGAHFVVKPTWREYDAKASDRIIGIDPGMAFGTGSHATTSLCLEVMEELGLRDKTVLDIGTGSGILMVGAALLGATHITGTDIDPVTMEVAKENLDVNCISADRYDLRQGDLASVVSDTYDIVMANILTDVILRLLPDIHRVVHKESVLLVSGIIEENESILFKKMTDVGFTYICTKKKDGWVVLWGRYRPE